MKHAFAMATFDQFFITSHSWQISCKILFKKHDNFWYNSAMVSFSFILDSNFLCSFTRAKFIIQNTAILDTNLPWQFFLFILDFELCKRGHNNSSFFCNMAIYFWMGPWKFFSACIMGIIVYGSWHFLVYASYKFSIFWTGPWQIFFHGSSWSVAIFRPYLQYGKFSFWMGPWQM